MIYLCVRFPTISIDALLHRQIASQQAKRLASVEKQKILACNSLAHAQGVYPGMPLTQALSLDPDLQILTRNPEKEKDFLYRMATLLSDISPSIVYRYPDAVLVELHRCIKLHKSLYRIVELIEPRLMDRQCPFHLSLAHTEECAYLLTYTERRDPLPFIKTDGETLCTDTVLAAANSIALEYFPVKAKVIQQCHQVGFKQLGHIINIPLIELSTRYGHELSDYLQLFLGEKSQVLPPFSLKPQFSSCFDYLDGITNTQLLMQPVENLIHELCHYLSLRNLRCNQLTWTLRFQDHAPEVITIQLSAMQNQRENFLLTTAIKLDKLEIPSPISQVRLGVSQFEVMQATARDLFGETTSTISDEVKKSQLLDKLINRLGEESCVKIALTQEKLPEKSQRLLTIGQNEEELAKQTITNPHYATLKPFFMLQNPARLQSRHQTLYYQSEQLKLISHGEKFDSHWWQGDYRRTYYIAQSNKQKNYWVFKDSANQWWLHGIYS